MPEIVVLKNIQKCIYIINLLNLTLKCYKNKLHKHACISLTYAITISKLTLPPALHK